MISVCFSCKSPVEPVRTQGRERLYRGKTYAVPADFPISTCKGCGAEWMMSLEVKLLNDIFEQERMLKLIEEEYGFGDE